MSLPKVSYNDANAFVMMIIIEDSIKKEIGIVHKLTEIEYGVVNMIID